jgi:3-isopropylmalate dehydrogenase
VETVSREFRITILPGDGIGQEVVPIGERVIRAVAARVPLRIRLEQGAIGKAAVERFGSPLPQDTLEKVLTSDAVLFGAVGGGENHQSDYALRPEAGLLGLRRAMDLYANLRPVKVLPCLVGSSPLRPEVVAGTDLLVVRELVGGLYFGEPRGRRRTPAGDEAFNTMAYTAREIERVARRAFSLAEGRRRQLVSVDKANVLEVSLLWREIVSGLQNEYPRVTLTHQYVDNCAMQLIRDPRRFDVILTENLFGDILSDEAAVLAGSIGMLPSASLGERGALYEPVHGSAPDIAGRDQANPLATLYSVALMFRYSFGLPQEADRIEQAIARTLDRGYRTPDIATPGTKVVGTVEMGDRVLEQLSALEGARPG